MRFIENDDMLQTFPPDAPHEALHIRILPWRPGRNHDFVDPHVLAALPKARAVDAVGVTKEMPWRLVPWKRFDHLLRRPWGSGMLRHVEVNNPPSCMGEDHEHKAHTECHGRHREEIEGYQVLHVGLEKRLPCWGW